MQTLIQIIETCWTGASRGAPGSVLRNAVPERVSIPDCTLSDPVLLHLVRYDESRRFAIDHGTEVVRFAQQHSEAFPLTIEHTAAGVHVAFLGYHARRRPAKPVSGVLLEPNCWVRIIGNYRVAQESGWVYRKIVFNIFHGPALRANELMASKPPVARIDHQRHLW
ncbi:hypothetical protein RBA41_27940 [Massilia sp. CCM 9210]|uniref:hypothetical protein n=1 Tax=Massilia scottii TaxID=3057166 RepID=UPI002796BAA4|nr:hypothetical protein [Massilia sp. CCM 9210]MDQ1817144.1 hypothetical protein [Massilia sp. CCM 9210]